MGAGRVAVRLSPTEKGTMEYNGNGRDPEVRVAFVGTIQILV